MNGADGAAVTRWGDSAIFVLNPAGCAEPDLAIAASRAGAVGVLNAEFAADAGWIEPRCGASRNTVVLRSASSSRKAQLPSHCWKPDCRAASVTWWSTAALARRLRRRSRLPPSGGQCRRRDHGAGRRTSRRCATHRCPLAERARGRGMGRRANLVHSVPESRRPRRHAAVPARRDQRTIGCRGGDRRRRRRGAG